MPAKSEQLYTVKNPATQNPIANVAAMGKEETELAIKEASAAFKKWKQRTPHDRSILLKNWHSAIFDAKEDLAYIMSVESGKPIKESRGEVSYGASFLEFYAHECMRNEGYMIPSSWESHRLFAIKQPVGVCGIVTPWNFPMAMITRKLGPALAAGCTAVVKPAEDTPLTALALTKLAEDAGIPAGVINMVPGPREKAGDIGSTLATSKAVHKISFTGSTRVGKLLMKQAADTVKKVSLELGGNAPFIVFEDADVDVAVKGLMAAKYRNNGQTCVCSNRIYVHSDVYDEFTQKFVEAVKKLNPGNPQEENVDLGPLINEAGYEKTRRLVDDAKSKGAKVECGGRSSSLGDLYYEPTVLSNVDDSMDVSTEEIFGPVVPLFKFDDEAEVLDEANKTDSGLAGYFFSKDLARVWRVAEAMEVGMVGVNTGVISTAQAPFGGVKQSGLGREGSVDGIEEYLETKYICMAGLK